MSESYHRVQKRQHTHRVSSYSHRRIVATMIVLAAAAMIAVGISSQNPAITVIQHGQTVMMAPLGMVHPQTQTRHLQPASSIQCPKPFIIPDLWSPSMMFSSWNPGNSFFPLKTPKTSNLNSRSLILIPDPDHLNDPTNGTPSQSTRFPNVVVEPSFGGSVFGYLGNLGNQSCPLGPHPSLLGNDLRRLLGLRLGVEAAARPLGVHTRTPEQKGVAQHDPCTIHKGFHV